MGKSLKTPSIDDILFDIVEKNEVNVLEDRRENDVDPKQLQAAYAARGKNISETQCIKILENMESTGAYHSLVVIDHDKHCRVKIWRKVGE